MKKRYTRRDFIKVSTLVTGGLIAGFHLPGCFDETKRSAAGNTVKNLLNEAVWTDVNVYVKIAQNNLITVIAPYPEIGQGVRTSLPMIIADELDADWNLVVVEQAVTDKEKYGSQFVGGSTALKRSYELLRKTGAAIREMLIKAAAETWKVPVNECKTENSFVIHKKSNKKLTYGELTEKAVKYKPSEEPKLKNPADFSVTGKAKKKVDLNDIVTGKLKFGLDTQIENMVCALVLRPPIFGTKLKTYNADKALAVDGVIDVFKMPEPTNDFDVHRGGLVVVAENSFSAIKGRNEIYVEWTEPENNIKSSAHLTEKFNSNLKKTGTVIKSVGNFKNAYKNSDIQIEATYELPFVAHTNNEPQNTTVVIKENSCEIWTPTQVPNYVRKLASQITGYDINQINVHVTAIGGGFGRRLEADYAAEAIYIAKQIKKPVKLFWTREDDFEFDFFRPAGIHKLKAGIKNGKIIAWDTHHTSTSILTFNNTNEKPWAYEIYPDNYPPILVPNLNMAYSDTDSNIAVASLRAPGHNSTSFADGSFTDEIAHKLGVDPIRLHLDLIGEPKKIPYHSHGGPELDTQRIKDVILAVKEKSDRKKDLPKGYGQGFAFHFTFGGYVAVLTDVYVSEKGKLSVKKITAVADIGRLINPAGAEEQISGGIIDGLNITLNAEITVKDGKIEQQNVDTYPMLRISDAPEIDVHFINTDAPVEGVGEMGLPPVAASVCNAVFDATGKRIRSLPVRKHDLSYS